MDSKNYTEVLIDGNVYTLGGMEEESYPQKVASFINDKIALMRRQSGFTRQSAEYQAVMVYLNLADDYFKEKEQNLRFEKQQAEMEAETYSLKHELVTTQMKLEGALRELEKAQREMELMKAANAPRAAKAGAAQASATRDGAVDALLPDEDRMSGLEEENRQLKEEVERLKAVQAAKASIPSRRGKGRQKAGTEAVKPPVKDAEQEAAASLPEQDGAKG